MWHRVDSVKLRDADWSRMDGTDRVRTLANLHAMDGMKLTERLEPSLKIRWDEIDGEQGSPFAKAVGESMKSSDRFIINDRRLMDSDEYG